MPLLIAGGFVERNAGRNVCKGAIESGGLDVVEEVKGARSVVLGGGG